MEACSFTSGVLMELERRINFAADKSDPEETPVRTTLIFDRTSVNKVFFYLRPTQVV